MQKRAEARDEVRARILSATMALHDEKGVAPTTFADVAERAGVGAATVARHFPTLSDLVRTCGMHVWQEMRPPAPDIAPQVFADLKSTSERLDRLVEETDAFYARGGHRLALAGRDRELMPELDQFLSAVEGGIAALVSEALAKSAASEREIAVATVLMGFPVWQAFAKLALPEGERIRLRRDVLACGLKAAAR